MTMVNGTYTNLHYRLNHQNRELVAMVGDCDAEISRLERSDHWSDNRAAERWIDRRAALIAALETIH